MPLKKISVQTDAKSSVKKDTMPVLVMPLNDVVTNYNNAVAALRDAEATVDEAGAAIRQFGLEYIYKANSTSPVPVSSVKVSDRNGSVCMVSNTSKYNKCDGNAVEAVFEQLDVDINKYAQETAVAKFDSKVFLDRDGNFSEAIFAQFKSAIEKVAKDLGVKNPLTTETVVSPRPDFDQNRWRDFSPEQNLEISKVLPNTVSMKVVSTVETGDLETAGVEA